MTESHPSASALPSPDPRAASSSSPSGPAPLFVEDAQAPQASGGQAAPIAGGSDVMERAMASFSKKRHHPHPPAGDEGRDRRSGTVVRVTKDEAFVDLGPRMQGVISLVHFETPPQEGQVFEFSLHGMKDDLWVLSRRDAQVLVTPSDIEVGKLVKAKVVGFNTGGLELKVGNVNAFMPASQVDLHHVEDLATFGGQTLLCKVLEFENKGKRTRVTLSRRAVLAAERDVALKESVATLQPGQVVTGKVTRLEPFGAFVEIAPGVEGLLHVSNLSRQRVEDPSKVLSVGQSVQAQITEIQKGGKRIGLSMKALEANPWDGIAARFAEGTVLKGKVTRVAEFGAFIEVEKGIEGLVHISQLSSERVNRINDAVKVGQEFPVRVVSIDAERERLSLSRLDERGHAIGTEDAVDAAEIGQVLKKTQEAPRGMSLGSLFKKALEKK
ncbi:MAG: S1 RNA-binding domain-containing protein [Planctomycetes bacterium]|nr:S1 RNA-binding domain-containing protein [Planctomycetota bacterium]